MRILWLVLLAGCAAEADDGWAGAVDTLPNGMVAVRNPATGLWTDATAWRVTEVGRIGSLDSDGPDMFGNITGIEMDPWGRIWVLDGQAQELRVFEPDGRHVRTIGRKGGGPGEFNRVMGMGWGPGGQLWVVDPSNNRISLLDTAGTFVRSFRTQGGFMMMPWPGGFDTAGHFYNVAPDRSGGAFRMTLVRYDSVAQPLDTLRVPQWRGPENYFELVSADGNSRMRSTVPYSPGLVWRLTPTGDFWFAHTGSYELYRQTGAGDTVLRVTKPFAATPVTDADRDSALVRLEWFTRQGGKVDASRIPDVQPAIRTLHVADDGTVWVQPVEPPSEVPGTPFEIFAPDGRYLGSLRVPFGVAGLPIIRGDRIVAVTADALGVEYVVLGRIENYAVPALEDEPPARTLGTGEAAGPSGALH